MTILITTNKRSSFVWTTDNGLSLCETKDKCRKTKGRAVAGITELRICGITELRKLNFALLRQDNESTRPWLRQTTRQLVGRQPVGFAGITDLWNHGLTELWNYGKGKPAQSSQPFYTFYTFSTLLFSIPFSLLPLVCETQPTLVLCLLSFAFRR